MIPIDIDGQIKHQQNTVKIIEDFDDQESLPKEQAILASLEELKRIREVQVPEGEVFTCGSCGFPQMVKRSDYDTLRDLLKRESADAKHYREKSDMLSDAAFHSEERAEAAEAKLAAMLKLGEVMQSGVFWDNQKPHSYPVGTVFYAKLIEQAGVKK